MVEWQEECGRQDLVEALADQRWGYDFPKQCHLERAFCGSVADRQAG